MVKGDLVSRFGSTTLATGSGTTRADHPDLQIPVNGLRLLNISVGVNSAQGPCKAGLELTLFNKNQPIQNKWIRGESNFIAQQNTINLDFPVDGDPEAYVFAAVRNDTGATVTITLTVIGQEL